MQPLFSQNPQKKQTGEIRRSLSAIAAIVLLSLGTSPRAVFGEALTLQACIQEAMKYNHDVQRSRWRVKQAEADLLAATSDWYPRVTTNAGVTSAPRGASVRSGDWRNRYEHSLSIRQPLYYGGMYLKRDQAVLGRDIGHLEEKEIRRAIRSRVAETFWQRLAAQETLAVTREGIRVTDEQIREAREKLAVGLITETDLLKYVVERGRYRAEKARQTEQIAALDRGLNILMGRESGHAIELVAPMPAKMQTDIPAVEAAKRLLIEGNTELLALEHRHQVAELEVKKATRRYLPRVEGYYSHTRTRDTDLTETDNRAGLSISFDLFDGFQKKAELRKSRAEAETAWLQYLQTRDTRLKQLGDLYERLDTQRRLMEIFRENQHAAQKDFDLAQTRHNLGERTVLEAISAHQAVVASRTDLVNAKYEIMVIAYQIEALIGGPK